MRRLAALAGGLAVLLAAPVVAQTADSTRTPGVAPPEVLAEPAAALATDSSAALPRPSVAPFGPAPGSALTPVPAVTASLDVDGLLADRPAAFGYALGAPGRSGGVSLDGADPAALALTLDGRPLTDPFTGTPRLDLLPLGVLGPLRQSGVGLGRAQALAAELRGFRLGVPVTELRYLGGQDGLRNAGGTHAQTRRPPAFLRGGSDDARLTGTFHAATRAAAGPISGATLNHTDALGRLLLTRPGLAAEVGVLYTDRREGARAGVVSDTQDLDGVFEFETATARDPNAIRRTLRTEAWARARLPIAQAPAEVGISAASQRLIYTASRQPNERVHGTRLAGFAQQPLALPGHRLAVRVDAVFDAAPDTASGAFAAAGSRLSVHLAASDSVRIGQTALALTAGLHRVGTEAWPSASVRARLGPGSVGLRLGGRARPRIAAFGLGGIDASPDGPTTQTLAADAEVSAARGDWRGRLRLFASAERDGWHASATSDTTAAIVTLPSLVQGGAAAALGWRESARRGLYARLDATTRAVSGTADGLRQRVGRALPRAWGGVRVGVRAEDVGDGVLDLDLAAVGRGWTGFRSRWVEPVTGVLVLPQPGNVLGVALPARATLGLEATATFSAQASLFVRYDHALGGRLYDGAIVTQGEPLAPHVLRFGVFWALLN